MIKRALGYLPLLVLLSVMTALPLGILLLTSLVPDGSHPFDAVRELTFAHYVEVFTDPYTYELLANTFVFAGGSLLLGMSIAVAMAWFVERTDMPFKQYAYIAIFLPMAMPGFITAIGWTFLLNPTNGVINVFVREIFDIDDDFGPFNVYTVSGMIMVAGLSIGPTMFIMLSSVMRRLDPSLEESAYASGANHSEVMRRVVLPLMRPGLLSIFIYFFVAAVEMLEIPLVFGTNANFNLLSVTVYRKTAGGDIDLPNYGLSSTYALLGLIIGFSLLLIYFRLMRQADRYAVITGKGYRPKEYKLTKFAKYFAVAFFIFFVILKLVLPLLVLLWTSMLPYLQAPSWDALQKLTFKHYVSLFQRDRFTLAIVNTAIMMVLTSVCCMGLASVVAWVVVRGRGILARAIDVLAFLPHLLPGIVIALAILLTSVGTPLYGTLTIIIIGNIIRYLPFGVRMMTSVMYQVAAELEDAAYASGASRFTTFIKIILPLVFPAFINGIVWCGSQAMKDVTLPLFLVSTSNIVIAGLMWEMWKRGNLELTAAISVMLVVVLLCIITPLQMILRRKTQRLDTTLSVGL